MTAMAIPPELQRFFVCGAEMGVKNLLDTGRPDLASQMRIRTKMREICSKSAKIDAYRRIFAWLKSCVLYREYMPPRPFSR